MTGPSFKMLGTAFDKRLPDVAAPMKDGDVIAINGEALRGLDKTEGAETRMMVSTYAARLRLALAKVLEPDYDNILLT